MIITIIITRGDKLIHRRLSKNKTDRHRARSKESGNQTVRRLSWRI